MHAQVAAVPAAQDHVERWRLASQPVFSSADHPQSPFSTVGRLDDGYILTPTRFVVADGLGAAVHFVDIADGSSSTLAARRLGFSPMPLPIRLTDRFGERVVVPGRGRPFLDVLSSDGHFVDQALVDADGRLWLRLRRRLGAEAVRWQVRDVERDRVLFAVEQRDDDRVWDARGDVVLTSVEDDLGVQRVRLRRLSSVPESR